MMADKKVNAMRASRAINAFAIVMLASFIAAGVIGTVVTARGLADSTAWVEHTLKVRDRLRRVSNSVAEAESANRGYLLSEDENFQQTFNKAIDELPPIRNELAELTADNQAQNARIVELFGTIEQKVAQMRHLQQIAQTLSFATSREAFDASLSSQLTVEIARSIDSIIAEEERMLHERETREASQRRLFFMLLIALLAATIVLAALAFAMARRQLKLAKSEAAATQALNAELEERVRVRTADLEIARTAAETEAANAEHGRRRVELLLRDLNHRVGNNLSMVSALLGMQAARTAEGEARAALNAARERVFMIGSAQRRLQLGEDLQSTRVKGLFTRVVDDLIETVSDEAEIGVHHDYEDFEVDSRDAVTLAVVLGELVTNALKHAFAERKKGTIWAFFKRNDNGILVLGVSDDGGGLGRNGLEDRTAPDGIGSMVINEMSRQFGGTITRGERPGGGALVSVSLPQLQPFEALSAADQSGGLP